MLSGSSMYTYTCIAEFASIAPLGPPQLASCALFTSERARRRASQWIMVVRSWRRGSKSSCPNHLQILADMAILMEHIVVRYEKL